VKLGAVGGKDFGIGMSAGKTAFNMQIVGCGRAANNSNLSVKFSAKSMDENGNLSNIAATDKAAKGVVLQLTSDEEGSTPIDLTHKFVTCATLSENFNCKNNELKN